MKQFIVWRYIYQIMNEQVTVTMLIEVTGYIYEQPTEQQAAKLIKEALEEEGWENVKVIPIK